MANTGELDVTTVDGRVARALLIEPGPPAETPLFLSVHGSGEQPEHPMHAHVAEGLAERGIASLRIRTRQSGDGVNTDSFYDSVRDIEAAFWAAIARGHTRIVLHGHSLGSTQAAYLAATLWRPELRGVVLTGAFSNLPWKTRHLLVGDDDTYLTLRREAREAVVAGHPDDELPTRMPWIFGRAVPVTARHFLSYRDTQVAGARTVEWLPRIPYPLALLRDEHDPVVAHWEFDELRALARDGISPSVTAAELPSEPGPDSHWFEHSRDRLVTTVADWIGALPNEGKTA
ncbi:lysophospholipase [Herbiconiux sp. CPCC 205763]|uniref:Lysophospholipase n=1 Tax=Herbiconiux aconitum TaxID=2970913 RepID=A0ABT2GSR6_9MICO|nr:lysophospholipase [Herbiconiux aconitum]MCS5719263.1 lysophospholipase [Herbiconiux aconitum]